MPTPANYVLGPGDEIIIDIWGDSELNLRYTIAPDGHITVPGLGRVHLSGLTVEQARSRLRNQFSIIYSDLDSDEPHTFLAMSVGNVRTIKVHVMGEVVKPGTYTLSSFASAFHALYVSGGPGKIGSLRNISVFRNGKAIAAIDIYEYLMKGNNMGDITLQDGDIVKVAPYGILAQIKGEVKRPMWYEMKNDETLDDLIRFAGGFKGDAYQSNLSLLRKGSDEMQAFTLNEPEYAFFRLQDGDQITVGNILDRFSNMVEITGAVYRPGKYAIGDKIRTVRDLVAVAQGPTGDAYSLRVLLYREKEDLTWEMESFDLDALLHGGIPDIGLQKNDRLHIPSVLSLEDSLTVYIGGEVRKPGDYPYAENMAIQDIILQAGGLKESASTARIDVYRRIKDPTSVTQSNQAGAAFTFSLQDGLIVSGDKSFTLDPFDQVVVRRSPGYEEQQTVTVEGEVLFGGEFAKIQKNEHLSSFIQRAGGLTQYAYPKGARLMRELNEDERKRMKDAFIAKTRMDKINTDTLSLDSLELITHQYVGIDLAKALEKPGGDDDIILREGDVLTVPEYNGTVKVSGGVMYPNTVTYNKRMSLESYVRQAGGYSRLAMKRKPFVIYMNGKVATGRWAKIEPGCEIVVPEKPDREPMSLQGILGISTSLASIALLISNLVK
jgi:Periplasmic protein involved in polysaccharide export